jgi:hypothetical protein
MGGSVKPLRAAQGDDEEPAGAQASATRLGDIEVLHGVAPALVPQTSAAQLKDKPNIPPPLNMLVDVNLERRTVVYEVVLGRELGFEILQGNSAAVVGQVRVPFRFLPWPSTTFTSRPPSLPYPSLSTNNR